MKYKQMIKIGSYDDQTCEANWQKSESLPVFPMSCSGPLSRCQTSYMTQAEEQMKRLIDLSHVFNLFLKMI